MEKFGFIWHCNANTLDATDGAAKMTEWMDISTAPKDGTIVIIYKDGKAVSAYWYNGAKEWVETMRYYSVPDPTYWMPLPEMPK